MRELILRRFFEGTCTGAELATDVAGAVKKMSEVNSAISIEDMDENFVVTSEMAVRLCDAVLSAALPPEALMPIGFALIASDRFEWDADDDEVMANVISDWSGAEVNYPLTLENVRRFRLWLTRSERYPPKPSNVNTAGKVITVTE